MRELIANLLLASCLLPVAAGGMQLSSDLAEPVAPHTFANLDTEPLWPSKVKRVDPNLQAYERLPAALAMNTMVAEAKPVERVKVMLGATKNPSVLSRQVAPIAEFQSAKAQEWCGARYRSFDPTNNTYQPYGGGPRRTCSAPEEIISHSVLQAASVGGTNEADANTRWCIERYSSYRIEDNTYQPFTGGRKHCPGLGSHSASNDVRTAETPSVIQF